MLEELTGKVQAAGQGWSTDPITRKAIEDHAMSVAEEHYVREGWSCTNCSASEPYDLHLSRRGHSDLRVEVKGTRSDGSIVLLTRNEVCHAREHYPNVALFVVHSVDVQVGPDGRPVVSGGAELYLREVGRRARNPGTAGVRVHGPVRRIRSGSRKTRMPSSSGSTL